MGRMAFPADFQRMMDDAIAKMQPLAPPGTTLQYDQTPLVVKQSAYMAVSDDLLMDYGVIPDTRPPVQIPWRHRLRWWITARRERVGRKVGSWIAGVDLHDNWDD
jgi:hypothetical protein